MAALNQRGPATDGTNAGPLMWIGLGLPGETC